MCILTFLCTLLLAAGVPAATPAPELKESSEQSRSTEDPEMTAQMASRKELLRLMEKLEVKLPAPLRRKLIIIEMKIATGWCSPYLAVEFEDEVNQLPASDRQLFEAEWKQVRQHKAWPRMPPPKSDKRSALPNSITQAYPIVGEIRILSSGGQALFLA